MGSQRPLVFVGRTTFAEDGDTSSVNVSLTTLSGGVASEPREGDIVIVAIGISGSTDRSYRISGYTQISDQFQTDTYGINLQVGWKVMGPTPDTFVTITGHTGDINDSLVVAAMVFAGVDTTSPLNSAVEESATADTVVPTAPQVTLTAGVRSAVIAVYAGGHNEGTDSYTEDSATHSFEHFISVGNNDITDASIAMGYFTKDVAAAFQTPNVSFTDSDNVGYSSCSCGFAIKRAT